MVRMIATKPLTYNTRRMRAGEEFDMVDDHAQLFVLMNLAAHAPGKRQQATPSQAAEALSDDLTTLRNQAASLGLTVDMRWGVKRLQSAIKRAASEKV